MRIAVFGGSFNPPHKGHVNAAIQAKETLGADKLLVIPTATAPHKAAVENTPPASERLAMTQLAFQGLEGVEVSDIEIARGGLSYTAETLLELQKIYPRDEFILLMGADMLFCFDEKWRAFEKIIEIAEIGVFAREFGQDEALCAKCDLLRERFGARINLIDFEPLVLSSTLLRERLPNRAGLELLSEPVYAKIIGHRFYGAKPDLLWLREQVRPFMDERRMPHVIGCEQEARRLAEIWGENPDIAAEAALLHDITKKQKASGQLKLCEKYDIITDGDERKSYKLLHSKTGAALSRDLFGIDDEIYAAIRSHTTGRSGMSLLEKIIYLADYIEPTRDFEGLSELRRLSTENLDRAVEKGLEMTIAELIEHGHLPHPNSINALEDLKKSKVKA